MKIIANVNMRSRILDLAVEVYKRMRRHFAGWYLTDIREAAGIMFRMALQETEFVSTMWLDISGWSKWDKTRPTEIARIRIICVPVADGKKAYSISVDSICGECTGGSKLSDLSESEAKSILTALKAIKGMDLYTRR